MKAKEFISKLRAIMELAALLVFIVSGVCLFTCSNQTIQKYIFRFWPICAGIIFTYAMTIFTEDYLNKRIIKRYTKLY